MIWTNAYDLPEPIVEAVKNDPYSGNALAAVAAEAKRKYGIPEADVLSGKVPNISMTSLIRPVRMRTLERRYNDHIIKDASDNIWTLFGQGMHTVLERAQNTPDHVKEQRVVVMLDGVLVHGAFDLRKDKTLDDYKVTTITAYEKALAGDKSEWEQQLNGGRWLLSREGVQIEQLRIIALLRDWMSSMAVQEGYPKKSVQVITMPVWTLDEAGAWISMRVKAHMAALTLEDEQLPECTADEMWEKPECWAIKRKGGARAAKLVKLAGEAGLVAANVERDSRNAKLKKNQEPFEVEHRPGERTRCERFCAAAPFCDTFKAYKAAAWKQGVSKSIKHEDVSEQESL
jgi:hypothetical protein